MTAEPSSATAPGLTPARLAALLGRPVTGVAASPLGGDRAFTGGTLLRLRLAGPGGEERLVAKLAPDDPVLRSLLARANACEAAFYRTVAPQTPCAPRALHAAAAPDGRSLILLPDLSDHAALPLVAGCPPDRALAAVRALARIHARWWGAPPPALSPADPARDWDFAARWPAFRAAAPGLPPGLLALGDRIAGQGMPPAGPPTLTHGDAHLENVLFPPGGGALWIDWQMAGAGAGAADLCYFLASSLAPEARRAAEGALLAAWVAELAAQGVRGYGPGRARADLRAGLAGKLVLTVAATLAFDNSGPARAAYRRADLDRLAAFAADHLDAQGRPLGP